LRDDKRKMPYGKSNKLGESIMMSNKIIIVTFCGRKIVSKIKMHISKLMTEKT
jgi:hypothetical protein